MTSPIKPPYVGSGELPLHGDYNDLLDKAYEAKPPQFIPLKNPGNLPTFRLTEILYPMQEADAELFYSPDDCAVTPTSPTQIVVRDVIDIMGPQIDPDSTNGAILVRDSAAIDTCGFAQRSKDTTAGGLPIYDIVSLGGSCCGDSASPSSPSSPSPSSPTSSVTPSGIVSSPSPISSPSSPISSSSSSSSSSSLSSVPSSSLSASKSSSKSTAIVEASWTAGGYTALFVEESPDVRFNDILEVDVTEAETVFTIDPRLIEVCEKDTLIVRSWSSNKPIMVGVSIEGNKLFVETVPAPSIGKPVHLVFGITAIRKGFKGLRFPSKTKEEHDANEAFLNMSKPK